MSKEKADPSKRRSLLKILWGRRWEKITIGIIVFIALILILIPYGIRYGAKRMILARGGDEARIEDVDFNPFTGRLALTGVDIAVDREQHLRHRSGYDDQAGADGRENPVPFRSAEGQAGG